MNNREIKLMYLKRLGKTEEDLTKEDIDLIEQIIKTVKSLRQDITENTIMEMIFAVRMFNKISPNSIIFSNNIMDNEE